MVSMANTVVGVFDELTEAQAAREDLLRAGFREQEVRLSERTAPGSTGERHTAGERGGFMANVREFLGIDDEDTAYYEEASRRGGAVVTVSASQDKLDAAVDIIERHHPVDIDRRAEEWRRSGWQPEGRGGASSGREGREQERIPVAEERLKIGKKKERRGGVRIYRHTSEHPVEEDVRLKEERVRVQRKPADRPADESAFREKTVEAQETREEPVVRKESRVTEEVVVDKDVQERDEKVRDTLRKTDVDMENTGTPTKGGQGASGKRGGPRKPGR
jgi:uncharacterized protein (TIGR02271 family)